MNRRLLHSVFDSSFELRSHVWCSIVILVLTCAACNFSDQSSDKIEIELYSISPSLVLPGTHIHFVGSGFRPNEKVSAVFEGVFAGSEVRSEHHPSYKDLNTLVLNQTLRIFPESAQRIGEFEGSVTLQVDRGGRRYETTVSTSFLIRESLLPLPKELAPTAFSFSDYIEIYGDGFLLPGEGTSIIVLNGLFRPRNSNDTRMISLEVTPKVISRNKMGFEWTPDMLGLETGTLDGSFKVLNDHWGPGGLIESAGIPTFIDILLPALSSFTPSSIRRGQALNLLGLGFLPSEAELNQGTLFAFDGRFETSVGNTQFWQGKDQVILDGTFKDPGRIQHIVRPGVDRFGYLEGFGSKHGVFTGTVTPLLGFEDQTIEGDPWEGELEILPTLQVVYLKYTPTFSEALRKFGLRNVEHRIRQRILEVCRRDYDGYNIEFREDRPTDFVDYSVIELAGRDPNQLGLFGLDNTTGLDDGNIRLDDVIGGHNAETEEQGHFSYGGVFLESFLAFSPSLEVGYLPTEFRSSRFDDIFGPFIPELGGQPVQTDEIHGGPREELINKAIRSLGSILGNTVVHEIGHSLGMVSIPGQIHHSGRTKGLIMNPGQARSFEERAEIDGEGPAVWHQIDKEYLQKILPKH